MSRRDPASFRKNINRLIGGGCLLALIIGVSMAYLAIKKKAQQARQDPLKVLEVLSRAQKRFIFEDADGDGQKAPAASLEALAAAALIPEDWGSGRIAAYRYTLVADERARWAITADPISEGPGAEARDHYRRDGFDVVTAARGRGATSEDRVISSPRRRR